MSAPDQFTCSKCNTVKPISAKRACSSSMWCRDCFNVWHRQNRAARGEEYRRARRERYAQDKAAGIGYKRSDRTALPEYVAWNGMTQRCHNPKNPGYPGYGGRGITVCDRWRESFDAFYADMGPKPTPTHSIDRIDNAQGYGPDNCRWATKREQICNSSQVENVLVNGESLCIKDAAAVIGVHHNALYSYKRRHGGSYQGIVEHYMSANHAQ